MNDDEKKNFNKIIKRSSTIKIPTPSGIFYIAEEFHKVKRSERSKSHALLYLDKYISKSSKNLTNNLPTNFSCPNFPIYKSPIDFFKLQLLSILQIHKKKSLSRMEKLKSKNRKIKIEKLKIEKLN